MFPRPIQRVLGLLGAALAVFHGWVFVSQASTGRLEDPWLIFRWIAAAALIAALVTVRRRSGSVWGRNGISIWVLAALLHAPAVATNAGISSIALPETTATSVLKLLASASVIVGLWKLASLLHARTRAAVRSSTRVAGFFAARQLAAAPTPQFAPRPPPLRS